MKLTITLALLIISSNAFSTCMTKTNGPIASCYLTGEGSVKGSIDIANKIIIESPSNASTCVIGKISQKTYLEMDDYSPATGLTFRVDARGDLDTDNQRDQEFNLKLTNAFDRIFTKANGYKYMENTSLSIPFKNSSQSITLVLDGVPMQLDMRCIVDH